MTQTGLLNFWIVYPVFIIGAVIGDSISFWIGRKYKNKTFLKNKSGKIKKLINKALSKLENAETRNIYIFIFSSRFLGPISWVAPFLVGKSTELKYINFFIVNTLSICLAILQFYFFVFICFSLFDLFFENIFLFIFYLIIIILVFYLFQKKTKSWIKFLKNTYNKTFTK
jgi:membrane protein DedA with SNARE-associated domain